MSGSILVFQDSNYVYEYRTLCTVSSPNPLRGFAAGLVAFPSVPYCQSHQLITKRGMVNLANFRFTLKKIKSHQPMELPVFLSSGSVLLFPGVHEEEEGPFWWVLSVQLS